MPAAVFVQAEDEVLGVHRPKLRCSEQHDIRLVEGDGCETETVGQIALPFQISSRAGDEQTARVLVLIRERRVIT